MAKKMNTIEWIVTVLMIAGALNWGLVGVFNWNLVNTVFGMVPYLTTIVYALVGLSGLYSIYMVAK